MTLLHIAGLPVEELLIVALVTVAPLLTLIGLQIADRVRRIRLTLRRLAGRAPH